MSSTTESRKLAAIMFTDIVGYSAMSQKNEILALDLLELHRDMVRKVLAVHRGKEIKTIGDAFLLEFESALDAVNCAIAIQKDFYERNSEVNDKQKIYLRIGVHIGDVVHKGGDIYGDGVNISSRIEPLAQAGGICITEDVFRLIKNKIDQPLHKMGKQELKNIDLPIDTYLIQPFEKRIVAEENSFAPSGKDRLAVLPFQNFSPDNESDYFSDGLTEELIMQLSRIKELEVVSRTTTMHYKNTQKDMHAIGRELNARYILEGSVRKYMDDLRITAQLIDVKTDAHLWANTFKGVMADIFEIQENVAQEVVDAFKLTLTPEQKIALGKRPTSNTEAYDLNLHARGFLYKKVKSYTLAAIDLFQKAVEIDPRYAAAYAGLGEAYAFLYEAFDKNDKWLDLAMEASLKALMYDAASAEAYSALGVVYYVRKSYDEALTSINKAIELDPNDFFSYWIKGRIFRAIDRPEDSVAQFEKVLELNPDYHTAYDDLRMVYHKLGRQQKRDEVVKKALEFYPKYLLRNPDDFRAMIFHATMLQVDGRNDEAKAKMIRALELSPNESTMMYNAACFFSRQGEVKLAVEHLEKAVELGFESFEYVKRDPDLDPLREDSGYLELMKGK